MKYTVEGTGAIDLLDGEMFIDGQPLSSILEKFGIGDRKLCGSIRLEITGKEPGVTVKEEQE